jgi:ankyrin
MQVRFPVNAIKPDGATALFLAAQEGHSALALLLIDAGAQIDLPDEDGISPLYIACYQVGC